MKTLLVFAFGIAVGVFGHAYYATLAKPALDTLTTLKAAQAVVADTAASASLDAPSPVRASAPASASGRFPVERTITNRAGVAIAARLLARNEREVLLVRLSDAAAFRYPIESLSEEDQRFVRSFSENALPAGAATVGGKPSAVPAEELRLIKLRTEVDHQIELLEMELSKQDDPNPHVPRDEVRRQLTAARNLRISIDQELKELRFTRQ